MNREEHIRLYGMSLQLVERELDAVELAQTIDLQRLHDRETQRDRAYYPQFTENVRKEAAAMAQYYESFYCLERSIRDLVRDRLSAEHGAACWDVAVPHAVRENVERNVVRERDAGVTVRSTERIDYTNFGELGEIVKANWQTFSDTFNSEKALTKVMTSLNILRGPIAHCCLLAEDEIVRLRLTIGDWFRLME